MEEGEKARACRNRKRLLIDKMTIRSIICVKGYHSFLNYGVCFEFI